jgi:hypothetical protein
MTPCVVVVFELEAREPLVLLLPLPQAIRVSVMASAVPEIAICCLVIMMMLLT